MERDRWCECSAPLADRAGPKHLGARIGLTASCTPGVDTPPEGGYVVDLQALTNGGASRGGNWDYAGLMDLGIDFDLEKLAGLDGLSFFIQAGWASGDDLARKTCAPKFVIKRAGISESGSVLVYNPDDGKLHLFNEDGFLFQHGFLDETKPWKAEFSPYEGLAGLAFATAEKQVSNDVQSDPRFAHDGGGDRQHDLHADQHFQARAALRCRLLSQHSRHEQFR